MDLVSMAWTEETQGEATQSENVCHYYYYYYFIKGFVWYLFVCMQFGAMVQCNEEWMVGCILSPPGKTLLFF
jgi:hypothetical protein